MLIEQLMIPFFEGTLVTLRVFAVTLCLSLPFSVLLASIQTLNIKPLNAFFRLFVLIERDTPLLLQMMFIFFGLPYMGITLDRETSIYVAFVLNYTAYYMEILRGGIQSVDVGQFEASQVLGYSKSAAFLRIILPQAFQSCLPSIGNEVLSLIKDTSLITVTGLGMVGVIGVNYRIFQALAENGISVFMVSQASSENSTSIGVRNQDAELACKVLNMEFAKEIEMGEISPVCAENNLATIAIVGERMKHTPGIAGKLFGTLGRNGISVIAFAQGASETNISFVVEKKNLRKSLNVIHDSFFLSEYQVLNLFICGTGTVGDSLIKQLASQQEKLMEERGLKLNVVGIANGHQAYFNREGLDLFNYRQLLDEKGTASSPQIIRDEVIGMNIFNSVFVDCTANASVSALYKDLLNNNVSVVAANKIAASSLYADYTELKQIARNRGVKFLFETNVGAGLPIIKTINDLIASGDKILKIEAVVSGTLNFIFNKISADVPFSETIRMAKEEGYSEPDPRIDLSGKDVIRKLVILAREAGYVLEQDDVEKNLFVPDEFFQGSLEDFWKNIPSLDADFEARRQVLEAENKHWKFVAKLEDGKGSVSLQEVSRSHPFYGLEGSNNIVLLTTERYKEYPMMIQGYGAGASVTAAGVFADIISVANI